MIRRPHTLPSSPRKRGPILRSKTDATSNSHALLDKIQIHIDTGVMGPRVRGDDDEMRITRQACGEGEQDDDITRNSAEEPSERHARRLELRARERQLAAARRRTGPGAQSLDERRSLYAAADE